MINALKHGFRAGAEGEILVSYDVQDSGWRFSVSDNGSGTQDGEGEPVHTGLGTSIVEALAHQLNAIVQKTSGPEGTAVTITAAAIDNDGEGGSGVLRSARRMSRPGFPRRKMLVEPGLQLESACSP